MPKRLSRKYFCPLRCENSKIKSVNFSIFAVLCHLPVNVCMLCITAAKLCSCMTKYVYLFTLSASNQSGTASSILFPVPVSHGSMIASVRIFSIYSLATANWNGMEIYIVVNKRSIKQQQIETKSKWTEWSCTTTACRMRKSGSSVQWRYII